MRINNEKGNFSSKADFHTPEIFSPSFLLLFIKIHCQSVNDMPLPDMSSYSEQEEDQDRGLKKYCIVTVWSSVLVLLHPTVPKQEEI